MINNFYINNKTLKAKEIYFYLKRVSLYVQEIFSDIRWKFAITAFDSVESKPKK